MCLEDKELFTPALSEADIEMGARHQQQQAPPEQQQPRLQRQPQPQQRRPLASQQQQRHKSVAWDNEDDEPPSIFFDLAGSNHDLFDKSTNFTSSNSFMPPKNNNNKKKKRSTLQIEHDIHHPNSHHHPRRRRKPVETIKERPILLSALIVLLGFGVSAAFLALGIKGEQSELRLRVEKQGSDISKAIESTWNYYRMAAMWIHDSCRSTADHNVAEGSFPICSRTDFRSLYEYLLAVGLEFQSIAYVPNVTHDYRASMEEEGRQYYQTHYPSVNYTGFMDLVADPNFLQTKPTFQPAANKPFYFPQHLVEPVLGNEYFIDFDTYFPATAKLVDTAVTQWTPILSNPVFSPHGRYVFLMHPGVRTSTKSNAPVSTGLSSITVFFSSIIKFATARQSSDVTVYIYDITRGINVFFGGVTLKTTSTSSEIGSSDSDIVYDFLPETNLTTLRRSWKNELVSEHSITVEQQTWLVLVKSDQESREKALLNVYVILGSALILITCCCLALWFHARVQRMIKVKEIKSAAEAEKVAVIVHSVQKAAQRERELNEYLAHEVRNPLAAALSACSFLSFAHQEDKPIIPGDERHTVIREDIKIVHNSLTFINDLLRSMLDMHRTRDKQVTLIDTPTDIRKDILEPIRTILLQHEASYEILLDCPDQLVIMVDRMRLKQVVLNLASNAKKFVEKGFIRLCAHVVNGDHDDDDAQVRITVEDSGPGIPVGKRKKLFAKFQESLDSLDQGTGIGLSLCKSLVKLMGGQIYLDESYCSGVPGCSGTRFVVLLRATCLDIESMNLDDYRDTTAAVDGLNMIAEEDDHSHTTATTTNNNHNDNNIGVLLQQDEVIADERTQSMSGSQSGIVEPEEEVSLPDKLSVLVVDDDKVLRKLLSRSIKRVAPGWVIQEAANGETALEMTAAANFDLIFMDQYMASVEKQLLGTETVAALRAKGVQSRICGLSANDSEEAFYKAGANYFLLKPFRCEKKALEEDLLHALYG